MIALAVGAGLAVTGYVWGPAECRIASVGLALALSWAAAVDLDRFILPDIMTLGLTLAGLAIAAAHGWEMLGVHAIGAAAGYAALALIAFAYRRWRGREGLGLGDAKLMAAAGAWLGWAGLPSVLLAGSFAGILLVMIHALATRQLAATRAIAFGPFIAMGFWIVWLFGPYGGYPYATFAQ
jgi:leader peptidase (prepilin peptidase) / N-methyltransferase